MVLINYATKEIVAKVVYYGPALCGKTTNLQFIYTKLSPKKRGKMISLSTESDRTLFFDFLPMELGKIQGFKVRFQLYTVPGQVFYGATRKLVLKGADAIVFVADSQEAVIDMNIESIEDMKMNLIENNLDPETIPLVIQYNKRDLNGIMEVEDLNRHINWRGVPYTEAVAITGPGVMETFFEITKLLIQDLKKKHAVIDSDAIKELPPDIFEQDKKKEEGVLEAEDIVFEIEHGSGYRHETEGEEVVAGEMLDMIETIAVSDSSRAEEFFDDVRKGVSTEEAKEKVLSASATDERIGTIDLAGSPQVTGHVEQYVREDENIIPVGERELTPEELDLSGGYGDIEMEPEPPSMTVMEPVVEPVMEADPFVMPVKKSAPEPAPTPRKARTEKKSKEPAVSAAPKSAAARPVAEAPPAARPAPPPAREVSPPAQQDMRMTEVIESLARLAKDVSQLGTRIDKLPVKGPEQPAAPLPDITPELADMKASLGRLEQEVSALRLTLTMMKESTANAIHSAGQGGGKELKAEFDELKNHFREAFEGQDRLLLAVLEAARESKQTNADAHEKLEDALRYILGNVRGEGGKKKWF